METMQVKSLKNFGIFFSLNQIHGLHVGFKATTKILQFLTVVDVVVVIKVIISTVWCRKK